MELIFIPCSAVPAAQPTVAVTDVGTSVAFGVAPRLLLTIYARN
jgi:hypothetical protein